MNFKYFYLLESFMKKVISLFFIFSFLTVFLRKKLYSI